MNTRTPMTVTAVTASGFRAMRRTEIFSAPWRSVLNVTYLIGKNEDGTSRHQLVVRWTTGVGEMTLDCTPLQGEQFLNHVQGEAL